MKRSVFLVLLLFLGGCGYTTKSLLPENIQSIHVEPVKNVINLSSEVSHEDRFRVYRPGVEVDVTNAIINAFIFDGRLKVVGPSDADAIVETKLVDYRRDPLRYSEADDVQEYRLTLAIDCAVYELPSRKLVWHESALSGDTTFFLSGAHATSEDQALAKAVEDVARRVIEKTMEVW